MPELNISVCARLSQGSMKRYEQLMNCIPTTQNGDSKERIQKDVTSHHSEGFVDKCEAIVPMSGTLYCQPASPLRSQMAPLELGVKGGPW